MSEALAKILRDAERWLNEQSAAETGSAEWYAHNNFRDFLSSLSESAAPPALKRAGFIIRRQISDQFDWDAPYSKAISSFVERINRYAREEAWQRTKNASGE